MVSLMVSLFAIAIEKSLIIRLKSIDADCTSFYRLPPT